MSKRVPERFADGTIYTFDVTGMMKRLFVSDVERGTRSIVGKEGVTKVSIGENSRVGSKRSSC